MMIAEEGEVLRMGWLKKQKKTWRKWVQLERRYFRLTKDALSYYKTDTEVRFYTAREALALEHPEAAGRGRGGNGRRRAWGAGAAGAVDAFQPPRARPGTRARARVLDLPPPLKPAKDTTVVPSGGARGRGETPEVVGSRDSPDTLDSQAHVRGGVVRGGVPRSPSGPHRHGVWSFVPKWIG